MNTPMQTRREDERRLAERAAQWLQTLEHGGAAERAAFAQWLKESPLHVREVLLLTAWNGVLEKMDPERSWDLDVLMAKADRNVVSLDAPTPALPRGAGEGTRTLRWGRWAAVMIGIALLGWAAVFFKDTDRYTTAVGEQRTLELEDGSVVYLNTGSRVDVHFSSTARDLRLLKGEGLFKVQQDATRPFRVRTDDAMIQAIGTQFNVRRSSYGTTVAVIEGRVLAAGEKTGDPIRLTAGEEARIGPGKPIVRLAKPDLDKAIAWRQRRLVFRKDTLADIAAEFNRYNRTPQIRVEAESLRARQFNGVFDADDPESLLKYLGGDPAITFDRRGNELVIRPRAD